MVPAVGDHIWLLIGDQLEDLPATLYSLCLVCKRFFNIFTRFLYRNIALFGIYLHHLETLAQSPYLCFTRSFFAACLSFTPDHASTAQCEAFFTAVGKMDNLRSLVYV